MPKLPELVCLTDVNGNWDRYLEVVYAYFVEDFLRSQPYFRGTAVRLKRHPIEREKEATFWHLVSEGNVEADRTIDLRRCERIRWPKPMIEGVPHLQDLMVWEQSRRGETRIAIALSDFSYVVILAVRQPAAGERYVLPWTAFCAENNHRQQRLRREWETFSRTNKK